MTFRAGYRTRHATTTDSTPDWRHHAACTDNPDQWFPDGTTGPHLLQAEEAKAVCRRCPAMEPCAEWALATRQEHGIWGGLGESERRNLLRQRARNARDTA